MEPLAWIAGIIAAALLVIAFRRKRVAERIEYFASREAAQAFAVAQEDSGDYHCWIEQVSTQPPRWEVRCYRRK
ncbi:hypothetical protein [Xanthomonas sp. NCPPB 1128]|uniref:hypothetical protein n=1 Tax=Xanthomonas sp. NCPPB 1128 TaxID=1775876 RepID=UPI00065A9BC4|nr:hypothetical protein [Xanthomonas sp. NCPPB 1128]